MSTRNVRQVRSTIRTRELPPTLGLWFMFTKPQMEPRCRLAQYVAAGDSARNALFGQCEHHHIVFLASRRIKCHEVTPCRHPPVEPGRESVPVRHFRLYDPASQRTEPGSTLWTSSA